MLKDKGKSGIYCWTSPSGKQYVGLAKNLEVRKRAFLKFYKDYNFLGFFVVYLFLLEKK